MPRRSSTILIAGTLSVIIYIAAAVAAERQQLSASEVREIFIERSWKSPDGGSFFFSSNGTYTYNLYGKRGPWSYHLSEDGVIRGKYTNYTFYRMPNGNFQYFHSRSKKFYRAYPR